MKKTIKHFSLLLTAALVIGTLSGASAIQAKKKNKVKISSVKILNTKGKLRIQKGKKFTLKTKVTATPNKSKNRKVTFTSSNKNIVSVNSRGVLTGKKKGTAKITVISKINKKKKARISVTVTEDVLVSKIELNKTKIEVSEETEEDIQLEIKKLLPSNAKNKEIVWETDDDEVADVDDEGLVIIGEEGEAVITATAADNGGAYAECTVIVTGDGEDDDEDDGEEVMDTNTSEDVADND